MAKKKSSELKIPNGKSFLFPIIKVLVMKAVYKKPKVINLAGEVEKTAIVVANHASMSGPPSLHLYYPNVTCKWGAGEMFGNHKMRKEYLRDILYIKKRHLKPGFATSFKAWLFAWLNPIVYRGMRNIPTFTDARLLNTIKVSTRVLTQTDMSIMVYPENSNSGYFDVMTEFFPGFVMLANNYYRVTGKDLPVYPVYFSTKKHIMVIGKPLYVQDMVKQGMNRYQIAEVYKNEVNKLYFDHVEKAEVYNYKKDKQK